MFPKVSCKCKSSAVVTRGGKRCALRAMTRSDDLVTHHAASTGCKPVSHLFVHALLMFALMLGGARAGTAGAAVGPIAGSAARPRRPPPDQLPKALRLQWSRRPPPLKPPCRNQPREQSDSYTTRSSSARA